MGKLVDEAEYTSLDHRLFDAEQKIAVLEREIEKMHTLSAEKDATIVSHQDRIKSAEWSLDRLI